MKLFRNIFAGEKKPKTLADKLAEFDSVDQSSIDTVIASDSEDPALRVALLSKASSSALTRTINNGSAPELEKRASELLASRIDDGSLSDDVLLAEIQDTEKLLTVAAFCRDDTLENKVLTTINDQALIIKLCGSATSTKVRQLLAEKIELPDALRDLAKSLKNKDKNAYKTIKTKLDTMRQEEQIQAERKEKVTTLIEEICQLSKRDVDRETQAKLSRLQRRWMEVKECASEAECARFAESEQACEAQLAKVQSELEKEREREEALRNVGNKRKTVLDALWEIINDIYALEEGGSLAEVQHRLAQQREQWQALNDVDSPNKNQLRDYTQLNEAVAQLFEDYEKHGSLQACSARVQARVENNEAMDKTAQNNDVKYLRRLLFPIKSLNSYPASSAIEGAKALLLRVDADYAKRQEDQEKNIGIILGLIRKANAAVDGGRLKQAVGVRHSIDEKCELLDGEPEFLKKKLESLDEAIQKLIDWQAYAVVPKKKALIEAMEKLVGANEPPEALATKIKKLQDEWRGLSQSGKDRKEDLWETFSALADKAYAPCKIHYDKLGQERQANLQKRQQLVQQLQDFYEQYNWEEADWKDVEKILRTAKKELHNYVPVERSANKEVMQAFDVAHASIQTKLDEEFAKNRAAREQLIAQAEKLTEMKDVEQAIEGVKRLQAQWKKVGRCHFKDHDVLWKAFRTHCDKIFDTKAEQNKAQRAATDEIIEGARTLVNQLTTLCALEGDALLAARAERDQLQQSFGEIEGLPEKVQRAIERDLNKAADAFDKKVAKVLRDSASRAWQDFFTACEKINHYHHALVSHNNAEALREDTEAFIESVSQWPEGTQSFVKQKLLQVADNPSADTDANLKTLKLLCIRAEILADQETPETDKGLRMEYQVRLLQQGMTGQAARVNSGSDIAEMAKDWSGVGPVANEDYKSLFERFYASWRELS